MEAKEPEANEKELAEMNDDVEQLDTVEDLDGQAPVRAILNQSKKEFFRLASATPRPGKVLQLARPYVDDVNGKYFDGLQLLHLIAFTTSRAVITGLAISCKKIKFGSSVGVLGYILKMATVRGIGESDEDVATVQKTIDPCKAKAIKAWPLPETAKDLNRFLCVCLYNATLMDLRVWRSTTTVLRRVLKEFIDKRKISPTEHEQYKAAFEQLKSEFARTVEISVLDPLRHKNGLRYAPVVFVDSAATGVCSFVLQRTLEKKGVTERYTITIAWSKSFPREQTVRNANSSTRAELLGLSYVCAVVIEMIPIMTPFFLSFDCSSLNNSELLAIASSQNSCGLKTLASLACLVHFKLSLRTVYRVPISGRGNLLADAGTRTTEGPTREELTAILDGIFKRANNGEVLAGPVLESQRGFAKLRCFHSLLEAEGHAEYNADLECMDSSDEEGNTQLRKAKKGKKPPVPLETPTSTKVPLHLRGTKLLITLRDFRANIDDGEPFAVDVVYNSVADVVTLPNPSILVGSDYDRTRTEFCLEVESFAVRETTCSPTIKVVDRHGSKVQCTYLIEKVLGPQEGLTDRVMREYRRSGIAADPETKEGRFVAVDTITGGATDREIEQEMRAREQAILDRIRLAGTKENREKLKSYLISRSETWTSLPIVLRCMVLKLFITFLDGLWTEGQPFPKCTLLRVCQAFDAQKAATPRRIVLSGVLGSILAFLLWEQSLERVIAHYHIPTRGLPIAICASFLAKRSMSALGRIVNDASLLNRVFVKLAYPSPGCHEIHDELMSSPAEGVIFRRKYEAEHAGDKDKLRANLSTIPPLTLPRAGLSLTLSWIDDRVCRTNDRGTHVKVSAAAEVLPPSGQRQGPGLRVPKQDDMKPDWEKLLATFLDDVGKMLLPDRECNGETFYTYKLWGNGSVGKGPFPKFCRFPWIRRTATYSNTCKNSVRVMETPEFVMYRCRCFEKTIQGEYNTDALEFIDDAKRDEEAKPVIELLQGGGFLQEPGEGGLEDSAPLQEITGELAAAVAKMDSALFPMDTQSISRIVLKSGEEEISVTDAQLVPLRVYELVWKSEQWRLTRYGLLEFEVVGDTVRFSGNSNITRAFITLFQPRPEVTRKLSRTLKTKLQTGQKHEYSGLLTAVNVRRQLKGEEEMEREIARALSRAGKRSTVSKVRAITQRALYCKILDGLLWEYRPREKCWPILLSSVKTKNADKSLTSSLHDILLSSHGDMRLSVGETYHTIVRLGFYHYHLKNRVQILVSSCILCNTMLPPGLRPLIERGLQTTASKVGHCGIDLIIMPKAAHVLADGRSINADSILTATHSSGITDHRILDGFTFGRIICALIEIFSTRGEFPTVIHGDGFFTDVFEDELRKATEGYTSKKLRLQSTAAYASRGGSLYELPHKAFKRAIQAILGSVFNLDFTDDKPRKATSGTRGRTSVGEGVSACTLYDDLAKEISAAEGSVDVKQWPAHVGRIFFAMKHRPHPQLDGLTYFEADSGKPSLDVCPNVDVTSEITYGSLLNEMTHFARRRREAAKCRVQADQRDGGHTLPGRGARSLRVGEVVLRARGNIQSSKSKLATNYLQTLFYATEVGKSSAHIQRIDGLPSHLATVVALKMLRPVKVFLNQVQIILNARLGDEAGGRRLEELEKEGILNLLEMSTVEDLECLSEGEEEISQPGEQDEDDKDLEFAKLRRIATMEKHNAFWKNGLPFFVAWNIDGVKAAMRNTSKSKMFAHIKACRPVLIFFTETKLSDITTRKLGANLESFFAEYEWKHFAAERRGHAGTSVGTRRDYFRKVQVRTAFEGGWRTNQELSQFVESDTDMDDLRSALHNEGRYVWTEATDEFEKQRMILSVYATNAREGLRRLTTTVACDRVVEDFIKTQRPDVVIGDFNRIPRVNEGYVEVKKQKDCRKGLPSLSEGETRSFRQMLEALSPDYRLLRSNDYSFFGLGGRGYTRGARSLDFVLMKEEKMTEAQKEFQGEVLSGQTDKWCLTFPCAILQTGRSAPDHRPQFCQVPGTTQQELSEDRQSTTKAREEAMGKQSAE